MDSSNTILSFLDKPAHYSCIITTVFLYSVISNTASAIDFNSEIRPLLSEKCYKCHGYATQKGKLRLDRREDALSVITPNHPEKSELFHLITTDDEDDRMPKDEDRLTDAEIEKIKQWIQEGAPYEEHWAYVAPTKKPLPKTENSDWARNPIDHFILEKIEKANLTPAPQADKETLVRRLFLDLIGLPPNMKTVDAFLNDPAPNAYEKLVDKLLQREDFGERWAQPWLDLARYADSNGYQHDDIRPVWPYRDWVIQAMNNDMPFDQFTTEQLAGDLLPNPTIDQRIATAFNRTTAANLAGGADEEESQNQIWMDRTNTTATIWLASTFECAQCHDHKYDPVGIEDYYRLMAYFKKSVPDIYDDPVGRMHLSGGKVQLPMPDESMEKYKKCKSEYDQAKKDLENAEAKALETINDWEKGFMASNARGDLMRILSTPKDKRTQVENEKIQKLFFEKHPKIQQLTKVFRKKEKAMNATKPAECLVLEEAKESEPGYILIRGDYLNKGEKVTPAPPRAFRPSIPDLPENRLGLAQWLTNTENPLVARVTVNRWWAEIFGRGIVTTTEDFGLQSEPPTHPELLDWLAVEFVENGWSMKHILKLIVMSATYQQSTNHSKERFQIDPQNELYARGARFRLSAEGIRDNLLAISGVLYRKKGGPPVYPPQPNGLWAGIDGIEDPYYPESFNRDRFRRGIYVIWRRGSLYTSFLNFDATIRSFCTTKRARTNTPLQALTLLNDPAFVEISLSFAKRINNWEGSFNEKLTYAFRTTLARHPTTFETETLANLYKKKRQQASKEPAIVKIKNNKQQNPELVAWFYVAQTLLNLDETITKN